MPNISRVRTSLGSNLRAGYFDFDTEGAYGNYKTKNYLNFIGVEKAYDDVKQLGKELLDGQHQIQISKADTWLETDAYIVITKNNYLKAFVGTDLKTGQKRWFVVYHD